MDNKPDGKSNFEKAIDAVASALPKRLTMTTWLGHEIDLMKGPTPEQIMIEDIAHHLAMQVRFNGAINRFYSIGEHCCYVAAYAPASHMLYYLLHDAAEYITGDFTTPIKQMIWGVDYKKNTDYNNLFNKFDRIIIEKFNLSYAGFKKIYPDIKAAEHIVHDFEKKFLRGPHTTPVTAFPEGHPLYESVFGMSIDEAEKTFLSIFNKFIL